MNKQIVNPKTASRDYHIAALSLQGMDSKQIAAQPEINISDRRVRQILTDQQCRNIIDHAIRQQIAATKGINKEFIKLCYHDDPKIKLDAIKQWQKNIGIAPSHTSNVFFTNIYNDNRGSITPDVERLFGLLSGSASCASDEAIDADFEAIIDT